MPGDGEMGRMTQGDAGLPTRGEAFAVWARIGLLSFGGPAGQIALMHKEIVENRQWVSERRFLHALSFCHLLPGPEAQQLATYLGWLMHGTLGGVVAGSLFVLPGAIVMLGLSLLYALLGHVPVVDGLFYGLRCAVLALVVEALQRIAKRALKTRGAYALAAAAFAALYAFAVPYPVVVLGAGLLGAWRPALFGGGKHQQAAADGHGRLDSVLEQNPGLVGARERGARRAGAAALLLWLIPLAALMALNIHPFAEIAWFFSKMAVVTIGGAYAVLGYVAQDAVQYYHWVSPAQMLAGLGLAETTPGPLILVLQFVGFLAGFQAGGVAWAIAAAALTLWVTFLPCFAFVFLGAPLIERLAANRALAGALAAITASVAGVVAQLSVWFGLHVLFTQSQRLTILPLDLPVLGSFDAAAMAIAAASAVLVFRLRLPVPAILGLAACAGLVFKLQ